MDPKLFRQVRKALGLTQARLATALGVSRVTVNKMERGRLKQGIPDEIGERLVDLQRMGKVVEAYRERFPRISEVWKNDTHLWDNEEDEQ
jgi:predicted transcriptional regulator